MNKLEKIYSFVVNNLMKLVLLFLLVLSVISTCEIRYGSNEITYYQRDNVIVNVIILLVMAAAVVVLYMPKVRGAWQGLISKVKVSWWIFPVLVSVLSIAWIITVKVLPRADQYTVLDAVRLARNGDYSHFGNGGYFGCYLNQLGLFFFYYGLSFIVGYDNPLAYQLINCLALLLMYKKLGDICKDAEFGEKSRFATVILGVVFYPLILFATFIYGNVPGFACAIAAIDYAIRFHKHGKWGYGVASLAMLFLGICLKQNMLIFGIGLLIYAVFGAAEIEESSEKSTKSFKIVKCVFAALIVVVFVASMEIPVIMGRAFSGEPLDQGTSSLSFIAMGLQEGSRANGWHNDYDVKSYSEGGYVTAVQEEIVKKEISERVGFMTSHPRYLVDFFTHKIASQWNNPTFQGFWVNAISEKAEVIPDWIERMLSIEGVEYRAKVLDVLWMFILAGSLSYFLLAKPHDSKELILATIFLGGFVFHLFWEAKALYSFTYVPLLFPYAIRGVAEFGTRVNEAIAGLRTDAKPKINFVKLGALALVLVIIYLVLLGSYIRSLTTGPVVM